VDEAVELLLESNPAPEALRRIVLGLNHEEQHQELLLTDILNAFFVNPLRPVYLAEEQVTKVGGAEAEGLRFQAFPGGMHEIGHSGPGFCYDNELPRHRAWLEPYSLASRLVTCGEYAAFIADGGYRRHELWLSDGWDAVGRNGWQAPLYWTSDNGNWSLFTLRGEQPLDRMASAPVSHVSFFEADAYARWAGCRLATEFEWEAAAQSQPLTGNLLDSGRLRPAPLARAGQDENPVQQLIGDCWEWTASAYLGYPGYKAVAGALGEYNGKFMSGTMVLRGGSCVTPAAHIRSSYRNFFAPETRWQFSGIRLAK
jgi:ergothioneine biosynthesis protein EgtB